METGLTIPPTIASMVDDLVTGLEPLPNDLPAEVAKKHGAVALMGDIGGAWLLRSDGSLWEIEWDSEAPPKPLAEGRRTMALAVGAKRYPWLTALLPQVPVNAKICCTCRGEGQIRTSADRSDVGLLCTECEALGWKPVRAP
jgi:hypothetical protein